MARDIAAALRVLHSRAPLAQEPNVRAFVAYTDGSPIRYDGRPVVPYKAFARWENARVRVQARQNREERENNPLPCRACGGSFVRARMGQVRCADCIAAVNRGD